ncbi:MAG: DUF4326 domain-containing protein [Betaproteobacteria bacterium]|nr:DUF4326 domain-containing protein [Betaproteobacteria bacterium]
MDKPVRIQRKRTAGWKMPPNTVVVSRPSKWGNPFDFRCSEYCWAALSFGCRGDAKGRQEASVRAFREWIDAPFGRQTISSELQPLLGNSKDDVPLGPKVRAGKAPTREEIIAELRGKNLACWCKVGTPCHADVLIELANAPPPRATQGEK